MPVTKKTVWLCLALHTNSLNPTAPTAGTGGGQDTQIIVIDTSGAKKEDGTTDDVNATAIFTERLVTLGVDLSRVEFRGPVGLTDMMAEYADIDIALDPVPYNGGTTSLQAMWMGVPVITQMGSHFVSRMGASFMTAAGLPEWVAKDDDDYVAIAQKMASDRKTLLALKKGLRKRLQTNPAWDVKAHTRAIEHALLTKA